jgi:exodeoxyribonuclease V gamma subunit
MLQDPHVGDRDPRTEDRQMLLDALMAATDRLIVTYTGNDERTNLPRPPAVPVGELLDTIERTVSSTGEPVRDRIEIRHPLQPFDPRNFAAARLTPDRPWSFDPQALAGARALAGPRRGIPRFLAHPLPPADDAVVELDRLVRFIERPVRALLRDRLGISLSDTFDEVRDAMPVELDKLEEWDVGQRLLEGVLAGAALADCVEAERARGLLPPGALSARPLREITAVVEQLVQATTTHASGPPGSLDVNLALPDGRTLAGTVTGVCGDTIRTISYSRVRARVRLGAWVRLLALTAARPEQPFESVVIGRARPEARHAYVTTARIGPLGADRGGRRATAVEHLEVLLDLYDRGMREPLPLACETSAAYARAAVSLEDAPRAARGGWESGFAYDKEDRDPEHLIVYGGQIALDELLGQTPGDEERWDEIETTRFGQYARRLWDGLLAREKVTDT